MHYKDINFIKLGEIGIHRILEEMENGLDWESYKFRQQRYKDHSETLTVPLIWSEGFSEIRPWPEYERFRPLLIPVFDLIREKLGDGVVLTAILINLPAGASIGRHRDMNPVGKRFNLCHRIHIPLITNEMCIFEIEGEEINMKQGEIWEISNTIKMHSVRNEGSTDRIHLLIDYAPVKVWEELFERAD